MQLGPSLRLRRRLHLRAAARCFQVGINQRVSRSFLYFFPPRFSVWAVVPKLNTKQSLFDSRSDNCYLEVGKFSNTLTSLIKDFRSAPKNWPRFSCSGRYFCEKPILSMSTDTTATPLLSTLKLCHNIYRIFTVKKSAPAKIRIGRSGLPKICDRPENSNRCRPKDLT